MQDNNLSGIYKGIAKLICKLPNVEQKEVVRQLRFYLSHEAKKSFPNHSISQLAQVTGISRKKVSEYINQDEPGSVVNKESIILSELWKIKDKNNIVPLNGKNSFYSIAKPILNGSYKPQSALSALIETEAVEFIENGLLINTYILQSNKNNKRLCDLASKSIERYVDTLIFNFNEENEDKLFDQTHSSTRINHTDVKKVHVKIKKYLNMVVLPYIKMVIDEAESDVSFDTFPMYSVSMFEHLRD